MPLVFDGIVMVIYTHIGVGLSTLLVSTTMGNFLRASEREASDSAGLHVFFMSNLD